MTPLFRGETPWLKTDCDQWLSAQVEQGKVGAATGLVEDSAVSELGKEDAAHCHTLLRVSVTSCRRSSSIISRQNSMCTRKYTIGRRSFT